MEGNSNWKPNEQSVVNNAYDWRSHHEPDLRNKAFSHIVHRLKRFFTYLSINEVKDFAFEIEEETYGIATDKDDYTRKISEKILMSEKEAIDFLSGSSVNETNTLEPAVAAQVLQQQMQGREELLPQQPQNTTCMFQPQLNQPPHMQQQLPSIQYQFPRFSAVSSSLTSGRQNPQISALEVCPSYQQKMAELTQMKHKMEELEKDIKQMENAQDNGEYQGGFRVLSSQQSDTAATAQVLNQRQSLPTSQQLLPQDIQSNHNMFQLQVNQPHLNETTLHANFQPPHMQQLAQPPQPIQPQFPHQQMAWQNNGDFTASFRGMTQQNMHQQSQPMMYQSQRLEQLRSQNRSLQQDWDESKMSQAADSLGQNQNQSHQLQRITPANVSTFQDSASETVNASGGDWQEETYQKIQALKKTSLPFLSTYLQKYVDKLRQIDSLPRQKQEGIHKEIQSLRMTKSFLEQVMVFLNVPRSKVLEMHRDNLPLWEEQLLKLGRRKKEPLNPKQQKQRKFPPSQRKIPHSLQKRRRMKSKDENNIMASSGSVVLPSLKQNPQVIQSDISLVQQKQFHHWGMQQRQSERQQLQQPEANQQLQMPTSHETNEMNDVRMRQGVNIEAGLLQQQLSSSHSQLPTPLASPTDQLLDQEILPELVNQTGTPTQSSGTPFADWSIDRFIEEFISEDITNSREETIADRIPGTFQSSEGSRACLPEDLTDTRRRSLTTHEEQNQSKRIKLLITSQTDDGYEHLESEGDYTATSSSKVNKSNVKNM